MPISNYPHGFAQGVAIRGIPLLNLHGGNVFWVDSNKGADTGKGTHNQPFKTWDYTVGRCVAGDIIVLKAGHVETVTAAAGLALDVAGVTTIFLGSGANQAYVTFTTDVGADMDVDAASITLINPKFVAGIDALTGPIDINAADFTVVNGEYHDAAGIETTDCMIGVAAAARLCIDGWKYFKSDEAGTQKESHFQFDGLDDLILRNIHVEGDFDVGIIEIAGTDECLRMTMEDHFLKNTDPGNAPCATLDSECSGWARRLNWRNADGTVVDDVADINWASDALGYTTDGYSGDPIGTAAASGVEGKLDVIDEYHDVPAQNNTLNAQINEVIGNKTDAAAADAVTTDDTLVGYIKQLVTAAIVEAAQTLKLDGVTISTTPVAASLASFVASGGTSLGKQLPVSTSLVDLMGDFTGPHDGAVQDDNVKASLDLAHTTMTALPKCVVKADGAVLTGLDPIFTISGGPVRAKIVGLVTTLVGGAATGRLQHITTTPAATVELSAGAIAVDNDAVGTFYYSKGATSVFTPSGGLGFALIDPVTIEETEFLLAPGVVQFLASAAQDGVIAWYLSYVPLSPDSVVTAAA